MVITFLHIADDVKQYVALSPQFRLEICPRCGERAGEGPRFTPAAADRKDA